jgi:hypothetical protein
MPQGLPLSHRPRGSRHLLVMNPDPSPQADIVEAHEYGHMLGLKDEYNDHARNRGGVEYILPDGTTQQAKGQEHLMDTMNKQQDARQARYAITIAYAVQDMLNDNGRAVSRNKIIGDYT